MDRTEENIVREIRRRIPLDTNMGQEGVMEMALRILETIAEEGLCLEAARERQTEEHQKAETEMYALTEKLEGALKGEERKLLDEALDAIAEERRLSRNERFASGFRVGALIMMEVLEQQE